MSKKTEITPELPPPPIKSLAQKAFDRFNSAPQQTRKEVGDKCEAYLRICDAAKSDLDELEKILTQHFGPKKEVKA